MEALASVSMVGGYSFTYLDERDNVLCPECADKRHEKGENMHGFIHWEGDSLHCEDCNVEIESEYGNPDEDELAELAELYADNHDFVKYTIEDGCIVHSDAVNIYRVNLREWAEKHDIQL